MNAVIKNISNQPLTLKPQLGALLVVGSDVLVEVNQEVEVTSIIYYILKDQLLELEKLNLLQIIAEPDDMDLTFDSQTLRSKLLVKEQDHDSPTTLL